MLSPKPACRVVVAFLIVVAPARADDDLVRRRLGSRHAADGFDHGLGDLLSYRGVAASLRQPGDPV